ncbi:MAG: TIGR03619 family F420-dependent LLM class oxidoreductase [Myxococcota bacterium]|nr:TIGR03619 family F420-dependent LLM class oxidoreductase [Myxococcota bacterium]
MKLGAVVRTMGPQSTRDTVLACALAAEAVGLDEIWVPDHVAIPPDDAEGSGGRYLDPLATLAFLAAATERIGLGTGVLILPYRPPLPTAKWVATIQELSGGRLRLGVGVGWMRPEFKALGVDRARRGAITDETLDFLHRCFADDEVEANGQPFLFLPRPARPPIFVGGAPPHALERAVRLADGWMPMGSAPEELAGHARRLRELAQEQGRPEPEIVVMTGLPPGEAARDAAVALRDAGATRLVIGSRYADAAQFQREAERLAALRESLTEA